MTIPTMPRTTRPRAIATAQRLLDAMRARGYTSTRSWHGASTTALAAAAGVSYEMARRYLAGRSVPPADTRRRLERWLEVAPGYLDGLAELAPEEEAAPAAEAGELDTLLLERALRAVGQAQQLAGVALAPHAQAHLLAWVYAEAVQGGPLEPERIARLLAALTH